VRLEGLGQLKNPITSSGIEPATLRLDGVAFHNIVLFIVTALRTSNPIVTVFSPLIVRYFVSDSEVQRQTNNLIKLCYSLVLGS
jgi:hypothetical protein